MTRAWHTILDKMDFAEILNNNTVKKYIMDDHAADIVHTWNRRGVELMGVLNIDMTSRPVRCVYFNVLNKMLVF